MNKIKRLPYAVVQTERIKKLKQSFTNWQQLNDHNIAFTLTLNTDLPRPIADKIFTKFWQLADQTTMGNKRRRFKIRLERMVTTEQGIPLNTDGQGGWSRWHQHGTLKLPKGIQFWKLKMLLKTCATKCECVDSIQLVEIYDLSGWMRYTQKQYDSNLDAFNPFATHLHVG
jgi:hypothetical protein